MILRFFVLVALALLFTRIPGAATREPPAIASARSALATVRPAGVNVRDFGARGDGKTNDLPAIAAAIAATDDVVYLPAGVYVVESPITITKPVTMTGDGDASVIRAVDCRGTWPHAGDDAPLVSIRPADHALSGVTLRKLMLDGNCAGREYAGWEWNAGVEVAARGEHAPDGVWLRELHIVDTGGDGIAVRGDPATAKHRAVPANVRIEENTVERWHANRQGIAVIAGTRISIVHNEVTLGVPAAGGCPAEITRTSDPSSANFGIDLETNPEDTGDVIAQVRIHDNLVHNCNGGINISNSNHPWNAISDVDVRGNSTVAYGGSPLKPLQVNGDGIARYVQGP